MKKKKKKCFNFSKPSLTHSEQWQQCHEWLYICQQVVKWEWVLLMFILNKELFITSLGHLGFGITNLRKSISGFPSGDRCQIYHWFRFTSAQSGIQGWWSIAEHPPYNIIGSEWPTSTNLSLAIPLKYAKNLLFIFPSCEKTTSLHVQRAATLCRKMWRRTNTPNINSTLQIFY